MKSVSIPKHALSVLRAEAEQTLAEQECAA